MDNFAPAAGPDHYIVTSTRTREELLAREVPKCRVSVAGNSYQVWLIEPKLPIWNLGGKGHQWLQHKFAACFNCLARLWRAGGQHKTCSHNTQQSVGGELSGCHSAGVEHAKEIGL